MPIVSTARMPLPGERKQMAPKVSRRAKKAPPLSEEIVVDSDDDSESQGISSHGTGIESSAVKNVDAQPSKPIAIQANGQRSPLVPDTTSNESDDGPDDENESDEASNSSSSSGSETESGSESEEEGSSGSKTDVEESKSQAASTIKPAASQLHATHVRPAPPFEPPHGFQPVSHITSPSTAQRTFPTTDLANKQIWHITAPTEIPITSIQEVALDKVINGEAILSHKGLDYCFVANAKSEQPSKLLVPMEKGYKAGNEIVETLHLQQIVRLPHLSSIQANPARGSDAAASYKTPAAKAPRQQPKGLKMRFRPSGFGVEDPGTIGSSEGEDMDGLDRRQPKLKAPQSFEDRGLPKKRKHEHVNGVNERSSTAAKKSKAEKHKSRHSEMENGEHDKSGASASTSPHINGGQQATPASSSSMKKSKPNGDAHGHAETREEKAKRKEEKRRKKREREANGIAMDVR